MNTVGIATAIYVIVGMLGMVTPSLRIERQQVERILERSPPAETIKEVTNDTSFLASLQREMVDTMEPTISLPVPSRNIVKITSNIRHQSKNERSEEKSSTRGKSKTRSNVRTGGKSKSRSRGPEIIGGSDAARGAWPWQAFIAPAHCGGVLVSSCMVLTAKHCTNVAVSTIRVTLGEHNRNVLEGTEQRMKVLHIFTLPDIDVALLLLDKAVRVNAAVRPLTNFATVYPTTGSFAWVTGWGRTSAPSGPPANILQELEVPIVDLTACARQMNPGFVTAGAQIIQTHELCTGQVSGSYANAFKGDSGGPLVQRDGTEWQLIGIVSRGAFPVPQFDDYAVYVSISSIRHWIDSLLPKQELSAGAHCNCAPPVKNHDGTKIQAWYDGKNCKIAPAHPGCSEPGAPNKAFIYKNRYYERSLRAKDCPLGTFDSCNCHVMAIPRRPGVSAFIWKNSFYVTDKPHGVCHVGTFDSKNCRVATAPRGTKAMKYRNNWYTTARPTCDPPFAFDGRNCWFMRVPHRGFIWKNRYYVRHSSGNNCPMGTSDGRNCLIRSAPWATRAFRYGSSWYHTPRRQCDDGAFDGRNCLKMYPPPDTKAYIYKKHFYYRW